jgi:hypothetical protein
MPVTVGVAHRTVEMKKIRTVETVEKKEIRERAE